MNAATELRELPSRGCLWATIGLVVLAVVAIPVWWQAVGREARFRQDLDAVKVRFRERRTRGIRQELLALNARSPGEVDVIGMLAQLAERRRHTDEAIDWYCRVPTSSPDKAAWARLRAAELAMEQADLDRAESLAWDALELDSSIADARRLLMRMDHVLLKTRALRAQVRELDARGQLTVQDAAYYCLGHRMTWNDDARIWLEACLHRDPRHHAVRAALIRLHEWKGREDVAEGLRGDVPPDGQDAWRLDLAAVERLQARGDERQAARILASLPAVADSDSRVWLARGRTWRELGDPAAALTAFGNAAALDPYDPAATSASARLHNDIGDASRGKLLAERSLRQHELQEAVRDVMKAIEEGGSSAAWPADPLARASELARDLALPRESEIFQAAVAMGDLLPIATVARNPDRPRHALAWLRPEEIEPVTGPQVTGPQVTGSQVTGSPASGPNGTPRLSPSVPATSIGDPADAQLAFTDVAQPLGLDFAYYTGQSPYRWLVETLGGGVGAFDYDLDGWPDLFFSQGNQLPVGSGVERKSDCLFRNDGGQRMLNVTSSARLDRAAYGHGCAVGDLDNDGFPDLVVCNYGAVVVYHNRGDGTFDDMTRVCGVLSSAWSTSATFHDLDRDGDLDLYIVNYLQAPFATLEPCRSQGRYLACHPSTLAAAQDAYWENLGNGQFRDRTREAGVVAEHGKGLGVMIADLETVGQPLIFVANDSTPNSLYRWPASPAGKSPAEDVALHYGVAVNEEGAAEACMGVACGDVDRDGRLDLFVTNFGGETNTLYRNAGVASFVDVSRRARLANASREQLGFGCQLIDVDANGWLDLFVANGELHEVAQRPQLFYNRGQLTFEEWSDRAGSYFAERRLGRSVAVIDVNRDLLADLAVTYQEGNVSLLRNDSRAGNRIGLTLVGTESNRDAIGASLTVTVAGQQQVFRVDRCGGYMAANEPTVLVGCGDRETVEQVEVTWPSGRVEQWAGLATGQAYLILEAASEPWIVP